MGRPLRSIATKRVARSVTGTSPGQSLAGCGIPVAISFAATTERHTLLGYYRRFTNTPAGCNLRAWVRGVYVNAVGIRENLLAATACDC